jgi:CRISPR-associated protein Cas1
MRHLLNTLYVLTPENRLSLDGENVVVSCGQTEVGRFALHTLQGIVSFTYNGATPALMGACAARGIDLCFFSPQGRFLARTVGEERGNVLLRMAQYRIAEDPAQSCRYARGFVLGKVYNARWVLERATRDHPQRVPVEKLKTLSTQLAAALPLIGACEDPEQLRGLEGEAAQRYFDGFGALVLQQQNDFAFTGRSRRPPLDNINALLSFAYTLLANDCAAALESVGLDPYVGFMHRPRPGRNSLALDLMEELRAVYADRFVLACVNQKILTAEHLQKQESGAVWLTEEGRKKFLNAWQQKKQEELKHPFLGEKLPWGLVPYIQALLLARTIRGDMEEYPPFFWK